MRSLLNKAFPVRTVYTKPIISRKICVYQSRFSMWVCHNCAFELELELIQTQMAQKPMLRAEVGMRVRCANKASAE